MYDFIYGFQPCRVRILRNHDICFLPMSLVSSIPPPALVGVEVHIFLHVLCVQNKQILAFQFLLRSSAFDIQYTDDISNGLQSVHYLHY